MKTIEQITKWQAKLNEQGKEVFDRYYFLLDLRVNECDKDIDFKNSCSVEDFSIEKEIMNDAELERLSKGLDDDLVLDIYKNAEELVRIENLNKTI